MDRDPTRPLSVPEAKARFLAAASQDLFAQGVRARPYSSVLVAAMFGLLTGAGGARGGMGELLTNVLAAFLTPPPAPPPEASDAPPAVVAPAAPPCRDTTIAS